MDEILKKLNEIKGDVEDMDDSTMDESERERIGLAHFAIETCIYEIEQI